MNEALDVGSVKPTTRFFPRILMMCDSTNGSFVAVSTVTMAIVVRELRKHSDTFLFLGF